MKPAKLRLASALLYQMSRVLTVRFPCRRREAAFGGRGDPENGNALVASGLLRGFVPRNHEKRQDAWRSAPADIATDPYHSRERVCEKFQDCRRAARVPGRHSRVGGNPFRMLQQALRWVPACAGATRRPQVHALGRSGQDFRRVVLGNRAGSAAIEFGLAVPLLAILVTGVIEVGFTMYQAMQVTYAAEAGLFYATKNGWDQTGIQNAALSVTGLSGMSAAASQFCGCPSASGITIAACSDSCGCGDQPSQYIKISVSLTRRSIIPNSGLPLPATISAQSILRQN